MEFQINLELIKNDGKNGASSLAAAGLKMLKKFIVNETSHSRDEFWEQMIAASNELSRCRPGMASLQNMAADFKRMVDRMAGEARDLMSLKVLVLRGTDKLLADMASARQRAIENTVRLISQGDTVMTCSYSSTVANVFARAAEYGIVFKVIAAESQFKEESYGEAMAAALHRKGIDSVVVPDNDCARVVMGVDMVLLGADTIYSDGTVVNGYPSRLLAEEAAKAGIPVYVAGDCSKLAVSSVQAELEEGLDIIPADFITRIITDRLPS